ncbi:aldehyde dehydrogenase (NAD+) [Moraxella cuniculi DSM 21768]|uniref:Aldehyde dehydrogenase (NAD+) n=1 Tax=Moraxella cuniculi DSM 21768 TaxID=1122245 RepID=A0A1N7FH90_9GAMM|nr:aldehyde dehydrogenase family protein [Moraxella cuniculi]OOS02274.1 aldehyde dehydrogenase [Moraxella cuniculi]SIR99691.1 aldehyde dehydrogenase (NAD+) [Moraxella cuniculi DSM 21768]
MNEQVERLIRQICPQFSGVSSYINGQWVVGSGEKISVKFAHDGSDMLDYLDADESIVEQLHNCTAMAQQQWSDLTASKRGQLIYRLGEKIAEHQEILAQIESRTANKPIRDARGEVAKVAEMFCYYAGWADKLHGETIAVPTSHLNYTVYEPLGVVLQITPWNAPIFTCGWQIAPAITAGNAVILKPSELTPITSLLVAYLAEQVGMPKGLINVVAGYGHTIGQKLIDKANVQKVIFVGSVSTGKQIATRAAKRIIPCVLELGGKSANIVFEDADYDKALRGAQNAIFANAGQSCVAGSRLLIQSDIFDRFVADLAKSTHKFVVGNPTEEITQISPINNKKQFEQICAVLQNAQKQGASIAAGNIHPIPQTEGYYINPTVLIGDNGLDCAQQEIFGPVVVAIPFQDEDEAIRIANDSQFGLAGAVWTTDVAKAHRIAKSIKAGTIWINGYKTIHVSSPFGGYKDSGYGRSSGLAALHEYSQIKSVWVETAVTPLVNFGYGAQEA